MTATRPRSRRSAERCARALAIAVVLAHPPARALDGSRPVGQYYGQAWSIPEGLPQGTVWALAQTPDGYLWVGTEEGVARFDGVQFKVYDPSNTPELGAALVRDMLVDRTGSLWIATLGGGITRLTGGRFVAYRLAEGLTSLFVRKIYEDNEGRIWAGTSTGLSLLDEGGRFAAYGPLAHESAAGVVSIRQTRDGSLWVGTRNLGLLRWRDGRLTVYTTANGLPDDLAPSLHEDAAGRLWIGTVNGGVAYFENDRFVRVDAGGSALRVTAVASDRDGNVWIGTAYGLLRYREGAIAVYDERHGLTDNSVVSLLEDREGNLWVGTRVGGLNRLANRRFDVLDANDGVPEIVWSIHEAVPGELWLAGDGGLTRIRDGRAHTLTRADGLVTDKIMTVWKDRRGDVWAGSDRGLSRVRGDRVVSSLTLDNGLPDNFVTSLYEDSRGDMWIGTLGGLVHWHDGSFQTHGVGDGLSSNRVTCVLEAKDGALWVGTDDTGLNRWAKDGVTHFNSTNGLPSNYVADLYEDRDRVLWIGTFSGGLARLEDEEITTYRARDGLPSDTIFRILEDDRDNLWMSSNKGLFRVAKQDLEAFAEGYLTRLPVLRYGDADGLPSQECNGGAQPSGWRAHDGRLWFPLPRGILAVDPDSMPAKPLPPPVVIEEVRVNQRAVALANDLVLPPGSTSIELQYTGLSLVAPERIQFSYRLEGLDETWIDAGPRRTAYYTNVPPGEYRFRVVATTYRGGRNETGATLRLRVRPWFRQTVWFYLLLGGTAALVAFGAYRFRVKLLEARNALLEERNRIAQEVHDGVAQGIGGIAMQLEAARGAADWRRSARYVARARSLADETLMELRRSLSALRPASLDGCRLPEAIGRLLDSLVVAQARLEVHGDRVELSRTHEAALLRIAQEALYNSTRHGRPDNVTVQLTYGPRRVQLRVVDDGVGFELDGPAEVRREGFGLRSMRQRAEQLGGQLIMRSHTGGGTEITVTLPTRGRLAAIARAALGVFSNSRGPTAGSR